MAQHGQETTFEAAWARAFLDLQPEAQHLVRALALLDGRSISLVSASAVLEVPQSRAVEVLSTMTADHWGTTTTNHFESSIPARMYLAELAKAIPPAEIDSILTRIAAAITQPHTTENEIPPAIRTDIANVLRAAGRHRHISIVSTMARTAWDSPTTRENRDWHRELAHHGEQAAIDSRQPNLLIELLNNSAEIYSAESDWPGAERAWLRALALVEHVNDTTRSTNFFHLLTTNYLNWDRPHKAVDMLTEIIAIHERAGDTVKTVQTQAQFAHIMANNNRPDAAIDYFKRAEQVLREHPHPSPEMTSLHATILSDLGQIYVRLGKINTARNYYHQALVMVVDTDDHTAERIRTSQAALAHTMPLSPKKD